MCLSFEGNPVPFHICPGQLREGVDIFFLPRLPSRQQVNRNHSHASNLNRPSLLYSTTILFLGRPDCLIVPIFTHTCYHQETSLPPVQRQHLPFN